MRNPGYSHSVEPNSSAHTGRVAAGRVFMWLFIIQDAGLLLGLLAAYAYLLLESRSALIARQLDFSAGVLNTILLFFSGIGSWRAQRASERGVRKASALWLALTAIGGIAFLAVQSYEYNMLITSERMRMPSNLFDATFFLLTGFHGAHVLGGILYLLVLATVLWSGSELRGTIGQLTIGAITLFTTLVLYAVFHFALRLGPLTAIMTALFFALLTLLSLWRVPWLAKRGTLRGVVLPAVLYWQFVDAVWLVLFVVIYVL